ncbi:PaaX family transcriptional regulator C-terminal domain-containing protein [Aeromicrobium sp. CF4.19]|uniref:PaaX family transcriptional regulator n=1 Tax=Aeromicrobium sp. CF4.19 TaxID=3373082 RepID=UPI003EE704DD
MAQTPRSLILDLYGDYLRYVGPEVRLTPLTTLLAEFGVTSATARVTMSRLRREGWFTTRRIGRETAYTLSQEMLEVLEDGRQRIFAPPTVGWDGGWTMVIYQLTESERHDRERLRKALSWHGFGPLTTSTWLAPGDRREEATTLTQDFARDRIHILQCSSGGIEADRDLARRCWDLDELAASYSEFITENRSLTARAASLEGADALRARTELIATFRHFPFLDPRLPEELRPDDWPGVEAHEIFRTAHADMAEAAEEHVAAVVGAPVEAPRPESDGALRPSGARSS